MGCKGLVGNPLLVRGLGSGPLDPTRNLAAHKSSGPAETISETPTVRETHRQSASRSI